MSHFKDTVHSKAPFSVRIVEFGCRNCGRRWSSANGSLEDYQKCKNCLTECYPVGSRIREPNKFGNENRQTFQGHNKELCGKCARLGRSCMMMIEEYSDYYDTNDDNDVDLYYMETAPQPGPSLNTRERRPVTESYSLKQWPELTNLALRYLPEKPSTPSSSNRIKLVSASSADAASSAGMTAAETLTNAIRSAREDDAAEENYYNSEEEYYEDNYHQQDIDALNEIWDYESFVYDEDENEDDDYDETFNKALNCLENDHIDLGIVDWSNGDDEHEEKEEYYEDSEAVVYIDDNGDGIESNQHFDSSSQDEDTSFDYFDGTSSDDCLYEKQMNNRLLRRGRKHALQGRKNSLKLIVN